MTPIRFFVSLSISVLYCLLNWLLCGAIHTSDWLKSKLPFKGKYAAQLNFWLISELVMAMIISWVSLYFTYIHEVAKDSTIHFFNKNSLHTILNLNNYLIFPHALILMVYRASRMSDEQKLLKLEKAQLEKENIRAQFEALRQQVNPHFLFNSLNSLKALASTHPEQVENYVIQLSNTYRYLLNHRSRDLVLLEQELEFLKSYFYLLKMRFEKALEISMQIDPEYNSWNIPPLTLQILIENAVKHNIISSEMPLRIKIYTTGQHELIVQNNLQPREMIEGSSNFGLYNVNLQFKYLCSKEIVIENDDHLFTVTLPLVAPSKSI